MTTTATELDRLADMLSGFDTCMFVTDDAGTLRSRPMHPLGNASDGSLYFFSYDTSDKHQEIRDESAVNLAFDDGDSVWISVSGTARTVQDRAKAEELWQPSMRAWFPDGVETDGLCLIEVRLTQAEYWDQPNQTMVHLWGMAKAAITGETPDVGERGQFSL